MSINNANPRGEFLMMAVPVADNNGIGPVTNEPLMFGKAASIGLAGVAQNSYTPPTGIPNPQGVGVAFIGVFFLSVTAQDGLSPSAGDPVNPGDKIYASGGTLDTVTGCLYGFTLDTNASTGRYFGNALDSIPSGQIATIRVRLKVGG